MELALRINRRHRPRFRVFQTPAAFHLLVCLPGVESDELEVRIDVDGATGVAELGVGARGGGCFLLESAALRSELRVAPSPRCAFRVPRGVVLDSVSARFDQGRGVLAVRMPKSVDSLVDVEPSAGEEEGWGREGEAEGQGGPWKCEGEDPGTQPDEAERHAPDGHDDDAKSIMYASDEAPGASDRSDMGDTIDLSEREGSDEEEEGFLPLLPYDAEIGIDEEEQKEHGLLPLEKVVSDEQTSNNVDGGHGVDDGVGPGQREGGIPASKNEVPRTSKVPDDQGSPVGGEEENHEETAQTDTMPPPETIHSNDEETGSTSGQQQQDKAVERFPNEETHRDEPKVDRDQEEVRGPPTPPEEVHYPEAAAHEEIPEELPPQDPSTPDEQTAKPRRNHETCGSGGLPELVHLEAGEGARDRNGEPQRPVPEKDDVVEEEGAVPEESNDDADAKEDRGEAIRGGEEHNGQLRGSEQNDEPAEDKAALPQVSDERPGKLEPEQQEKPAKDIAPPGVSDEHPCKPVIQREKCNVLRKPAPKEHGSTEKPHEQEREEPERTSQGEAAPETDKMPGKPAGDHDGEPGELEVLDEEHQASSLLPGSEEPGMPNGDRLGSPGPPTPPLSQTEITRDGIPSPSFGHENRGFTTVPREKAPPSARGGEPCSAAKTQKGREKDVCSRGRPSTPAKQEPDLISLEDVQPRSAGPQQKEEPAEDELQHDVADQQWPGNSEPKQPEDPAEAPPQASKKQPGQPAAQREQLHVSRKPTPKEHDGMKKPDEQEREEPEGISWGEEAPETDQMLGEPGELDVLDKEHQAASQIPGGEEPGMPNSGRLGSPGPSPLIPTESTRIGINPPSVGRENCGSNTVPDDTQSVEARPMVLPRSAEQSRKGREKDVGSLGRPQAERELDLNSLEDAELRREGPEKTEDPADDGTPTQASDEQPSKLESQQQEQTAEEAPSKVSNKLPGMPVAQREELDVLCKPRPKEGDDVEKSHEKEREEKERNPPGDGEPEMDTMPGEAAIDHNGGPGEGLEVFDEEAARKLPGGEESGIPDGGCLGSPGPSMPRLIPTESTRSGIAPPELNDVQWEVSGKEDHPPKDEEPGVTDEDQQESPVPQPPPPILPGDMRNGTGYPVPTSGHDNGVSTRVPEEVHPKRAPPPSAPDQNPRLTKQSPTEKEIKAPSSVLPRRPIETETAPPSPERPNPQMEPDLDHESEDTNHGDDGPWEEQGSTEEGGTSEEGEAGGDGEEMGQAGMMAGAGSKRRRRRRLAPAGSAPSGLAGVLAGSFLVLSLMVLMMHLVKGKKKVQGGG